MSRALVTGGAGFLGSHIAEHLLKAGHEVTILDDLSGGFRSNVPAGADFVEYSILETDLVDWLFRAHRFDYVFHCAAYAAEYLSHRIRHFNYTNNVVGSMNLINSSIRWGVKCFVLTSSIAVYGSQPVPFTEDMTPRPEDPYGIAKYAVEMDLMAAHKYFGLDYIVFRPHNVYGERQNLFDPHRNVVAIFMRQALQGMPLTIYGDGNQRRAWSYIDDVAPRIARSVLMPQTYNGTYNIGSDDGYSVNELARFVQASLGIENKTVHLSPRNEVFDARASNQQARMIFGKNVYSLREGISLMGTWAKTISIDSLQPSPQIELPEVEAMPACT